MIPKFLEHLRPRSTRISTVTSDPNRVRWENDCGLYVYPNFLQKRLRKRIQTWLQSSNVLHWDSEDQYAPHARYLWSRFPSPHHSAYLHNVPHEVDDIRNRIVREQLVSNGVNCLYAQGVSQSTHSTPPHCKHPTMGPDIFAVHIGSRIRLILQSLSQAPGQPFHAEADLESGDAYLLTSHARNGCITTEDVDAHLERYSLEFMRYTPVYFDEE